jgi:hypothetical protein
MSGGAVSRQSVRRLKQRWSDSMACVPFRRELLNLHQSADIQHPEKTVEGQQRVLVEVVENREYQDGKRPGGTVGPASPQLRPKGSSVAMNSARPNPPSSSHISRKPLCA